MRRLSRVVATVTAVAAIGASAACGGDNPTPSSAPSISPSLGATPTGRTEPRRPAAAKTKTKQGAIAATRFFLLSLNYAGSTGRTELLRSSYTDYCVRCEAIANGIDATYRNGGRISGGDWQPQQFKFYSIQGNVAYVDAVVDYEKQTWTRSSTDAPEDVAARANVLKAFNLRWTAGQGWAVSALDPEA